MDFKPPFKIEHKAMSQKQILLATFRYVHAIWMPAFVRITLLICLYNYTPAAACGQQESVQEFAQKTSAAVMAHTSTIVSFVFNQCLSVGGPQLATDIDHWGVDDRPYHRSCKMPWRKVYRRCQLRCSLRSRFDYLKLMAVLALFIAPWLAWI